MLAVSLVDLLSGRSRAIHPMRIPTTPAAPPARGFSLIELVVTLALLAILAVLAAPTMTDWRRNQGIRGTAEALQTGLQTAREEAVRRNRPVSFWLIQEATLNNSCTLATSNQARGSWVVSVNNPAGKCAAARSFTDAPMLVASHEATDGVRIDATDADGDAINQITFNAYGRVAGGAMAAQIDIKDPSDMDSDGDDVYRSLRLIVSGMGSVHLCDPALDPDGDDPRRCPEP
ncbi:MAG: GspH/FimT family protein [Hydrogenophaga sp.]|nr:GspH/FimT family protein [Hydrogenophaga sp.]